jgi:glycosyltransferase involved in cell wall biosynthesis
MRIVYVLTTLGIGGAERQVVAIAERMAARGHDVAIMVLRPRFGHECPTSLKVVYLGMRKTPGSISLGLLHAHKFLRRFAPDLIHSHTYPASIAARALRFFGATPAVLTTIHSTNEGGPNRARVYRLTDFLSRHTTAVSEAVLKEHIRKHAAPRRKCSVLTNGIDTAEFTPNPEHRKRFRFSLKAGQDFIWFTAGRIAAAKDYPTLLRALAKVYEAEPQTKLWIAADTNNEEFKRLEEIIGRLGILQRVQWLGVRTDIPSLLDAADGFVLSSAWEGMPLAIGEAMAMQKPVVATGVGGVRELVGEVGALVVPKNADQLAAAMLSVMRSSFEARQALGCASRQRILDYFKMDGKAAEWERLYVSLAPARSRAIQPIPA